MPQFFALISVWAYTENSDTP